LGYVDPGRRQAANRILRAAVTLRARVSRVRADSAGGHLAGRGGGAGERAAPVRDVPRPASRGPDGLLRSRDELPQPVQEGGRMMAEKVLVRPALDLDARASTEMSAEHVRNLDEAGVVRLVIDCFTAMSQAFGTQGDIRVFTHMLLGKIIGGAGCTTLTITESAPGFLGAEIPDPGMQEFIADGVLHFHLVPVAGDARVRYIEITKMRGTNHQMGPIPIDIGNRGISVRSIHIPGRK